MNALSEYLLPLIFVVAFVLISIRKGADKKRQEEMTKMILPAQSRKSGELIAVPEPVPVARGKKTAQKLQRPASKSPWISTDIPAKPSDSMLKDTEEDFHEPVLDIENREDIKKAIIYTEIFKRKDY